MSVRTEHTVEYSRWFITFTCLNWLPLFEITQSYDLVYKWFNYLRTNKIAEVEAYVIMPNHLHAILYLPSNGKKLNTIVGNGKRFMAYEIVKRLQENGDVKLLTTLSEGLIEFEKKKGQKHKVFKPSFDGKAIFSDKFMKQKMDYIHHNPVKGKWSLASDFTEYEHSSASYYELGVVKHFEPRHYYDAG